MAKYKIGDVVQIVGSITMDAHHNNCAIGTITEYHPDNDAGYGSGLYMMQPEKGEALYVLENDIKLYSPNKEETEIDLNYTVGDIVTCVAIDISCQRDREDYASGKQRSPLVVGHKYKVVKIKKESYGNFVDVVNVDGDGVSVGGTYAHQFSKIKSINNKKSENIMSNIKQFVKNSLLSKEEKLLRKVGFKSECGEYTQDAIDVVINMIVKEKESELIKIATDIESENINNNNK